ncbi:ABC-type multidrug transport system, ATPase component [Bernardetia litoralis DSM 6794]|uniref:ABC-type multidrug transport system, ATPase component n=1 Tax=Bernardetia litoralis (strain ATCC 23117 / DSM 6794 / NBRC 15988 / NCIMB 1366 / Fx l1 / Sio-4) TaxID=880071 RepID=I4AIL4_BERLS|nr:ABC transporter ATP-binding protein [Bernardetia litoralis]AFM03799.1 ABC-type multidrug transport system, ATPase component [Bernardetia litoralis DSM 6794]
MIQAIDLTKKYGDFLALDNLTLSIKAGHIYCLLGANGAGKSTTINLFLGFTTPSTGKTLIDNIEIKPKENTTKSILAYIPENLMLYPLLTGIENLDYFSRLAKKEYSKQQLKEFLNQAGLSELAFDKRVETYSKGMRQKVGIAIALAKEAKALFLDEPTSGLDPRASNEFSEILLSLKEKGVAILMATHDIFRAKQVATYIGIMKEGKLVHQFENSQITLAQLEQTYLDTIKA